MTSRYTSAADVSSPLYAKMGQEYHDAAGEYVDQVFVKDAGFDPDELFDEVDIPWRLKQIALHRAMQLYAQDSIRAGGEGDLWTAQAQLHDTERYRLEKAWDNRMLMRGDINFETPDGGGICALRCRT